MDIEISDEMRIMYLITMAGSGNRLLYNIYKDSDESTKRRIIEAMAESWKTKPPYPNWKGYSKALADYAANLHKKPGVTPPSQSVASGPIGSIGAGAAPTYRLNSAE